MCQESRDLSQKVEEHAEEVNLNTTQSRRRKRRGREKFLRHHHPGGEKDTVILEVMTLKLINSFILTGFLGLFFNQFIL